MATYKVPQDVEADDKLIGPFSFRQFIYLIIVALAGAAAWGLAQIFIGLAIIPLPIIVFFGALALPLRKDQPMEIYMAAMVSFYLKPRLRKWDPEGVESLIEITAPKVVEQHLIKDLSQNEAEERLSYLATIVDSGGWAIRGMNGTPSTIINNDIYVEAQSATDVLDTNTPVAQSFNQMMGQSSQRARQEAIEHMRSPAPAPVQPTPAPIAFTPPVQPAAAPTNAQTVATPHYNPYPDFQQTIIQPLNDTSHQAEQTIQPVAPAPVPVQSSTTTSDTVVSADIINLANNPDLSIETIAHEANRLHKKAEEDSEEVIISLR